MKTTVQRRISIKYEWSFKSMLHNKDLVYYNWQELEYIQQLLKTNILNEIIVKDRDI